jgi:threonine dehydratase
MPAGAPSSKVEATRALGAEVCLVPGAYDDAYAHARELEKETHATFIHPFDDEDVIAGQGTIGLEILDQLENADAVVVPVGGGGLLAGVAYAIKQLRPDIKVYGVEAEGAASMFQSHQVGQVVSLDKAATFADGIAVRRPGELTFSLIEQYVDGIVTVTEDEIAAAILALIEKQKLIAEGAGAVSVAAAMFGKLPIHGKRVVCLVSGGNIDVNILSRVITRGLVKSGRNATLEIVLQDKPGQLESVCRIIAKCGANVVTVHHERSGGNVPIAGCYIRVEMETRDFAQIEEIRAALIAEGLNLVS